MWLEIFVIVALLSGVIWLFGGSRIVLSVWGGVIVLSGMCISFYVIFAFLHKWLGPSIFN